MKSTITVCIAALSAVGAAHGAWVGGALVTTPEWNAAASDSIGQQATVFRLFMAFDTPGDGLNHIANALIQTNHGETLYQNPFTRDRPSTFDFTQLPAAEWDSYVSAGNLAGQTLTLLDPEFHMGPTGLDDVNSHDGGGWLGLGAWVQEVPELIGLAPGALDQNGNQVIPAHFDDAYLYSFQAQFTVLGLDVQQDDPIFDGGFIHSDYFNGDLDLSWSRDENPIGFLTFVHDIRVGSEIPAPSALLPLCLAGACSRRRRSP